jgi:F0F1-type ATP synthase assembly protein I
MVPAFFRGVNKKSVWPQGIMETIPLADALRTVSTALFFICISKTFHAVLDFAPFGRHH